ncbi:hypothetical protein DCAR_0729108 [Daucus carota subsp. sativus]|uniref:Uncharacterized protein n=1 Tax=Daucus carota subsp. sativus TaxID=79200 RepID=A0A164U0U2_DAUCS|nr:PREDICTED: WEB family protein At2g17940 [Daucus carota subsp. sativus]WOH09650.1 hypothetical protein DCAR_0729108 [Daucus carota subsp. sativus]
MQTPSTDYHSNVDTSRPFSSVKEAVAVFGERFLTPAVYSPKPFSFPKQESSNSSSWNFFTPTPSPTYSHASKQTAWKDRDSEATLAETIKKLESELEETKEEVKLLKERETENEVALASLNAELHKNMSKIAQAEAMAARKAAESGGEGEGQSRRDGIVKMGSSPSLSQILSFSQEEKEELFGGRKKERKSMRKKKPIIPLVGDLFWRKKGSSTSVLNPIYSSPSVHWN